LLRFMSGIYCPTDLTITSQPWWWGQR
jgi:hypothetical protein